MTAIRDLHDLVMEPGLINPDEEVPVSLGWLHALYMEITRDCPGHSNATAAATRSATSTKSTRPDAHTAATTAPTAAETTPNAAPTHETRNGHEHLRLLPLRRLHRLPLPGRHRMTLHTYPDIMQGTEEWHDLRRGIVTASTVGKLITAKTIKPASNDDTRALTAQLVAERITGYTEPTYTTDDMYRGIEAEPIARELYAKHTGTTVTECGFMIRLGTNDYPLGYSPDGLVADDGLIEIKAPRAKTHLRTILADEIPAHYMAQCQAGLLVSGRKWLDFVSYCGGMPLWIKRVTPDPRWFVAIGAAVTQFETTAMEMELAYVNATDGLPTTERIDNALELKL